MKLTTTRLLRITSDQLLRHYLYQAVSSNNSTYKVYDKQQQTIGLSPQHCLSLTHAHRLKQLNMFQSLREREITSCLLYSLSIQSYQLLKITKLGRFSFAYVKDLSVCKRVHSLEIPYTSLSLSKYSNLALICDISCQMTIRRAISVSDG